MSNYLSKIIPSVMISASALTGCEQPQQPRTTLNNYMANRPAKEYIAIKTDGEKVLAALPMLNIHWIQLHTQDFLNQHKPQKILPKLQNLTKSLQVQN